MVGAIRVKEVLANAKSAASDLRQFFVPGLALITTTLHAEQPAEARAAAIRKEHYAARA